MPKLESYSSKLEYSYALGLYPCFSLLENRPQAAVRVLIDPESKDREGVKKLIDTAEALNIRVEEAGKVLRRESGKENCFAGIVFNKFQDTLSENSNHIVLNNISDSGNLGTILRSALGFNYLNVAVIKPCVDAFNPHVIRASMGAVFKLGFCAFESFDDYMRAFNERAIYPFMLDGAISLNKAVSSKKEPFTLVFGNEAKGLPKEFATYGQSIKIPQTKYIDSLNLSNAVSIAAYEFSTIKDE